MTIKTEYNVKIASAIEAHCVPAVNIRKIDSSSREYSKVPKHVKDYLDKEEGAVKILTGTNSLFHLISEVGSIENEELKKRVIGGETFTNYSDRVITYSSLDNELELASERIHSDGFSELVYDSSKDAIMISTTELQTLDGIIGKKEWRESIKWIVGSQRPAGD